MNKLNAEMIKPIFCPDATRGVVRGLDSEDLRKIGTETLIVNTLHLAEKPGLEYLEKIGGVKKLMNWTGQIISDSGGFQLFSMFHRHTGLGKVVDEGLKIYNGPKRQKFHLFTPEESIRTQFAIGSDNMVCLDDFTPPQPSEERLKTSVRRTLDWAAKSKVEFEKEVQRRGLVGEKRPNIFAPLQGHPSKKWRKFCADGLLEIGFDGYGLGGWIIEPETGRLDLEAIAYNTTLIPNKFMRYAMGVGKAEDILALYLLGYTIFDCVIPTRDARHGRLSVMKREMIEKWQKIVSDHEQGAENLELVQKNEILRDFYNYVYIDKGVWATDDKPLDEECGCSTCQNYSRAYLHHLYKVGDVSFSRLATIHNLYFFQELVELIGEAKERKR